MKEVVDNIYQRGNSEVAGIAILLVFCLVVWGILSLLGVSFGVENEGIVKYDDCRQTITIQEDSWQRYLKQFTCNYIKTKSGKIMSGECIHIVNDSSLFGSNHTCATAYVYQKKQDPACDKNTKDGVSYPYLGYDDMCYTSPQ